MKTVVIIQARMGSTRLPGKVMLDLCGKTVLEHVITRVKQAKKIDEIIIATTTKKADNIIVKESERLGVKYFRGSEEDVLERYYYAAKENNADIVVRVTSDCPLVDPIIIDRVVKFYKKHNYEIVAVKVSGKNNKIFPRGMDAEVFSFKQLETAFINAKEDYQREHVTPYIYENANKIYPYQSDVDYSKYRLTLDTKEDFELICKIYEDLYKGTHNFHLKDIIELFERKPELFKINAHIKQKKIK